MAGQHLPCVGVCWQCCCPVVPHCMRQEETKGAPNLPWKRQMCEMKKSPSYLGWAVLEGFFRWLGAGDCCGLGWGWHGRVVKVALVCVFFPPVVPLPPSPPPSLCFRGKYTH